MLNEGFDAASVAFKVGYESASQFSREYARCTIQTRRCKFTSQRCANLEPIRQECHINRKSSAMLKEKSHASDLESSVALHWRSVLICVICGFIAFYLRLLVTSVDSDPLPAC